MTVQRDAITAPYKSSMDHSSFTAPGCITGVSRIRPHWSSCILEQKLK